MRTIVMLLTVLVVLGACPIMAQQPMLKDPLLDAMTGDWVLKGRIGGRETVHDIGVDWVLGHQYVCIRETSREMDSSGHPAYEAHVYVGWDQAASEYVCVWLDVWGGVSAQSIGRAKPHGDEMPFVFRDTSNAIVFHTTFIYDRTARTWRWVMDNEDQGKLQPFARLSLSRK